MGFLATSKARSARSLASASTPAFRHPISTRSGCSCESSWNAVAGRRSSLSKRSSPDPGGARRETVYGGASFARCRSQMKRLFRCQISLIYTNRHGESSVSSLISDRTNFWWSEGNPGDPKGRKSSIRLGEEFFNDIIRRPIPLDMHILRALTRSTLGLDLYQWLNYRTFGLQRAVRLTWPRLYEQFGVDPGKAGNNSTVQHFRQDCLRELKKINLAWPGLRYTTPDGALVLLPSTTPSIPPRQFPLRPCQSCGTPAPLPWRRLAP